MVAVPSEADDALTVRQHLSTILLAQGEGLFRGRTKRHAIAQAEEWLQQVSAPVPVLKKQRMGTLTVLQRRIVDLSGAAVQKPGLIIVEEADSDLDDAALQRLGLLCQRLVQASGEASLILVGQRVGLLIPAQAPDPGDEEPADAPAEAPPEAPLEAATRRTTRPTRSPGRSAYRGSPGMSSTATGGIDAIRSCDAGCCPIVAVLLTGLAAGVMLWNLQTRQTTDPAHPRRHRELRQVRDHRVGQ